MRYVILPLVGAAVLVPGAFAQESPSLMQKASEQIGTQNPQRLASGQMSMRDAVNHAVAQHPELAAADAEVAAVAGASLQAQVRPNPEFAITQEGANGSSSTTTIQVSQSIELGGKREARIALADSTSELARTDLSVRRNAIAAAVVATFFDALIAQERVRLAEVALELAQRSTSATSQRVKAGKLSPVEESKAKVFEANARIELIQVRAEASTARTRLSSAMGRPLGAVVLQGRFDEVPPLPSYEELQAQLDQSPALQLARLEVQRRKAMTSVESARRTSDITFSFGAKRDQEQNRNQAIIGLSIPFPLFDRNQGNLMEAVKREDKARLELDAVRLRVESDVIQARERLFSARTEAQSLIEDVIPGAQSAYDAATKGFELGKFSFLETSDAQRTLLQANTQYLNALAEAHRAHTDLNRILGTDALLGMR